MFTCSVKISVIHGLAKYQGFLCETLQELDKTIMAFGKILGTYPNCSTKSRQLIVTLFTMQDLVKTTELCIIYYTQRVISDKVHRLLVMLESYFRPDRFVQLLCLIPILILLLYLIVSIDLVYTGLRELVPE